MLTGEKGLFCRICKVEKSLGEFSKTHSRVCQKCVPVLGKIKQKEAQEKLEKRHKKRGRNSTRKKSREPAKNPQPVSLNWKSKYGLTAEQGFDLLERQKWTCKICPRPLWVPKHGEKKPSRENTPCVDHKHGTQIVRGFLCSNCNAGLGMFQDNPELLEIAAQYLRADPPHIRHDVRGISQVTPLKLAETEDSPEEQEELAVEQRICKEA